MNLYGLKSEFDDSKRGIHSKCFTNALVDDVNSAWDFFPVEILSLNRQTLRHLQFDTNVLFIKKSCKS